MMSLPMVLELEETIRQVLGSRRRALEAEYRDESASNRLAIRSLGFGSCRLDGRIKFRRPMSLRINLEDAELE